MVARNELRARLCIMPVDVSVKIYGVSVETKYYFAENNDKRKSPSNFVT